MTKKVEEKKKTVEERLDEIERVLKLAGHLPLHYKP